MPQVRNNRVLFGPRRAKKKKGAGTEVLCLKVKKDRPPQNINQANVQKHAALQTSVSEAPFGASTRASERR